jgi:hypothetical protein
MLSSEEDSSNSFCNVSQLILVSPQSSFFTISLEHACKAS